MIRWRQTKICRWQNRPDASVHRHESGDLYAEDVDQYMAVLPELITSTAEFTIDDLKLGIQEYLCRIFERIYDN